MQHILPFLIVESSLFEYNWTFLVSIFRHRQDFSPCISRHLLMFSYFCRFCGVLNSYVKRTVDGNSTSIASLLKNDTRISVKPKTSTIIKEPHAPVAPQEPVVQSGAKNGLQSSSLANSSGKGDETASVVNNQTSQPQVAEESITVMHANKNKVKKDTSSAAGGSLASLWGRASTKQKPSSPTVHDPKFAGKCDNTFLP